MVDGAGICDEVIADIDRILEELSAESLTLAEAARRSGYTADHIARLVRNGTLTNAGRKHAPRVLSGELPHRPRRVLATPLTGIYDSSSDARSLRSRR
jgi:hypothetical protein